MNPVAVTHAELTDDVVTLTVASISYLRVGYHAEVQGIGAPYDGQHILTAVITTPTVIDGVTVDVFTVEYAKNHANVVGSDVDGRITPRCTWIGESDVTDFLGFLPDTQPDEAWLTMCTETANDFCSRRRWENGYSDLLNHVPSPAVANATVLYAAGLFRERGSIDSFSSFQEMSVTGTLAGSMGQIMRLLGLMRPRVA